MHTPKTDSTSLTSHGTDLEQVLLCLRVLLLHQKLLLCEAPAGDLAAVSQTVWARHLMPHSLQKHSMTLCGFPAYR